MGARPTTFRKGGGFLNGVDGEITGYRWTDEFNGEPFVPGKKPGTKDDKFHSLFMELSARADGADEDVTQNLFAGNYDDFEVSEDGLTLTSVEEGAECSIGANTAAAKFIASLCEAGFTESKFSDDPNSINFEPMVGSRVRFGQAVVLGKDGKPRKRIAKKGKFKGREFDDTTTIVEQVYESAKGGGKAGKAAPGKAGKKVKEEEAEDDDVPSLATAFLIKVVTANKGKMAKGKVGMQLLKQENGLYKHPEREAVRKLLSSDKFLNQENGWSYDEDKEIITVKGKAKADEDEDEDDE